MSLGPDAGTIEQRRQDWRCGPVVYQVFPDRFARPEAVDPQLFAHPRRLRRWGQKPAHGRFVDEAGVWSHELDFWGGTLCAIPERLGYLASLGVDVLYLNPITDALTNHRYDALDWASVAPELGGPGAVEALGQALHRRGMRLVLDGVFNHLGRKSARFQQACSAPDAAAREWFTFDASLEGGFRGWQDVANLPEVRLENPAVFAEVCSVVAGWLGRGVDGWRLDVAHDLGPVLLRQIRAAARAARPDVWVVGEIWAYPQGWLDSVDGLLNMHLRRLLLTMLDGDLSAPHFGRLLARQVEECGIEGLLRSWLILDNHDTPRLASRLRARWRRRLAWTLLLTLPGAPVLFYGSEVAMAGRGDPTNRGPMRWDRVEAGHPELRMLRALLAVRRSLPALRVGDLQVLDTERTLAYLRRTERVSETVLVVVNPTDEAVSERLVVRDPRLMTGTRLCDRLAGGAPVSAVDVGTVPVWMPPRSARVLVPEMPAGAGYSPYRRISL